MINIPHSELRKATQEENHCGKKFHAQSFSNTDYFSCDFSDAHFEDCSFNAIWFNQCNFTRARFVNCRLEQCGFQHVRAENFDVKHCMLRQLQSIDSDFRHARLALSQIEHWTFSSTQLDGLECADCSITYWTVQEMPEASVKFSGGKLHDAVWFDCAFNDSQFCDLELLRQVIGSSTLKNCRYHNVSGNLANWSRCTLQNLSLQQHAQSAASTHLRNLRFHQSTLHDCDFDGQHLEETLFAASKLHHCSLKKAHLMQAVFDDAELDGCCLDGVQAIASSWRRANLQSCSARDINLDKSIWSYARLIDCSFQGASFHLTQSHGLIHEPREKSGNALHDAARQDHPAMRQIDDWYQRFLPGSHQPKQSGGRYYV